MYSLLATAFDQFSNRPCARLNSRRLRWRHPERAMSLAEIVISKVQRNSSLKVFKLLTESVCEACKASAVHTKREVLAFDVRRCDVVHVGHSIHNGLLNRNNFDRTIPCGG